MGFFSGLKNFGSKILNGIKKTAGWVASTLSKVMGALSGPVSMLHPGIGGIMGTVGNIAGKIQRLTTKEGMEELYQLAQSLGKIYSASDYDVFKIFEALIDDKELDDEQKQFYEQKKIGLPYEQLTEQPAITQPLKDNVFPSAHIQNPQLVSLESAANDIVRPNGLFTQLLDVVNICHYPAIAPVLDVLLHPKISEEPPAPYSDLAILQPSSQPEAEGLIYILPQVALPQKVNVYPSADIRNPQSKYYGQLYTSIIS
ncbi:MAG: hypothetical protein EZS28_036000 [Streblomastix strix]|uniref:Uncharacterized protein n=1 Tax=Streblomastix strix TaxID=222440 RepID=A0A5J4UEC5_9EUKA|nr:MAG: hypothetical protein EZS28_036000 [Streblomastix strix]